MTHANECRSHYQRNKRYYFERNKRRDVLFTSLIRAAKQHPCADCGQVFPYYVMDFDHVRGKKHFNISSVRKISSEVRLREEIAKCDVVCANCHRIRTHIAK